MDKFLEKFQKAFDALNTSRLWDAIKSIISKLKALLTNYGEDEVVADLDAIFPEAE